MIHIEKIQPTHRQHVRRFVQIPFRLYAHHPQWVPPPIGDVELMLDHAKHPFYEHSGADFFIATRDGRDVGRIAALENCNYNTYHHTHTAQFYLFDCEDDHEAATALFNAVCAWARARGLTRLIGPKGFGPLDGYGVLVEGFEHRQMMTMMNYNFPYYAHLLEANGFVKEVDFVSCYLGTNFRLPAVVHRVAERALKRSTLRVVRFNNKRDLLAWATRIGQAYNAAFVNNWEYVPLTPREIKFTVDNIMLIADPRLIKIIARENEVVGFLFAFPDVSAALQRMRGHLFPFGVFDLLREMKRTRWVALNGAGILPQYHGIGGNALLYTEMEKTIRESHFEHADLTQVAETAVQMRQDLMSVGGKPYKNHRVYARDL